MAGALVAISALPSSVTILSTDVLPFVKSGTTSKVTAGNLRAQMFAFAATDPLNCGILTAVGNSTITGTLSGITTLTASTIVGNLTGNLTGTVLTAAQTNITSLGTLASLAVTGAVTAATHTSSSTQLSSQLLQTTNAAQLNFGTNSIQRWYIDGASGNAGYLGCFTDNSYDIGQPGAVRPRNVYIAGFGTFGGALTTGGSITMTAAASLLVPGATSFSHRNNANSADNLLITDAGAVTIRAGLTVTAGGISVNASTISSGGSATTGGLNIQRVGTPSAPNDGDKWITTANEFSRINGVTKVVQVSNTNVVGNQIAGWTVQTTAQTRADMGAAPVVGTVATTLAALIADLRTHGLITT